MKKVFSLILCILMLGCMFSSCSSKDSGESSENSESAQTQLKITTDFHYSTVDESVMRTYEKLCTAVIEGESEVKFNTAMMDKVNQLFYTSFPLYDLVESINYLEDNTGVTVTYKNDADLHKELVEQFTAKVSDIMKTCGCGKVSGNEYLFNVYSYITKNVTVDNSSVTTFSTIINSKGVAASISSMFEYLLLQGGVDACHLSNISSSSAEFLSAAEFNGTWYYFDVVSEIENNSGEALRYFAMNDERAGLDASKAKFSYTDQSEAEVFTDSTFDALKNSQAYTIENSKVTVKIKNSEDYIIEL